MKNSQVKPKCLNLYCEIEFLKNQLIQKIVYKDYLDLHLCKKVQTTYFRYFGTMEYEIERYNIQAEKLDIEAKRLQEALEDNEEIDIDLLEEQIDKKFEVYDKELEYKAAKIKLFYEKEENIKPSLGKEELDKIDKIYTEIIKKIHPLIKKEMSDKDYDNYFIARDAYKNLDVETLKSIENLTTTIKEDSLREEPCDDLDSKLNNKIIDLENKIQGIEEEIINIKNTTPYTLKEILDDEEKFEKHKKDLTEQFEIARGNYIGKRTRKIVNVSKKRWLRY